MGEIVLWQSPAAPVKFWIIYEFTFALWIMTTIRHVVKFILMTV